MQSRSFRSKPAFNRSNSSSNNNNNSSCYNNNSKFHRSRRSGGGIRMASGHLERSNGQAMSSSPVGHHRQRNYSSGQTQDQAQAQIQGQEQGEGQGEGQRQSHRHGQGQGQGQSYGRINNSTSNNNLGRHVPIFYRPCSEYHLGSHANLNPPANIYNVPPWSGWNAHQQQQHQQQLQQFAQNHHHHLVHQQHLAHQQQQLAHQQQIFELQPLQSARSHQLNVSAPSFTPASARAVGGSAATAATSATAISAPNTATKFVMASAGLGMGLGMTVGIATGRRPSISLLPSQSQPQLHTQAHSHSRSQSDRSNGRRQQLPDLFQTVIKLMRELNRSVSYPEMIGMLSMRLKRLPVELKRHIPHTLHGAVANGYLRKDGNYYTLLSEQEQKEIMKRNQEAAKRAKELEKEPLSWRIR